MTVVDDPTANRFEFRDGEHLAELGYRAEDGRLVLLHTEVPDELGGQGIGGQLVRAAVERAERTGEQIAPWCPFTRSWLEKHPDEAGRVTIDWSPAPDE